MLLAIVSLADRGAMEGSHPVDGMEVISTSREKSDTIRGYVYYYFILSDVSYKVKK